MARSSSLFEVQSLALFELAFGDAVPRNMLHTVRSRTLCPFVSLVLVVWLFQHGMSGPATRSSSGIADTFGKHVCVSCPVVLTVLALLDDCFRASPTRSSVRACVELDVDDLRGFCAVAGNRSVCRVRFVTYYQYII
ncbi:hypothetical protein C8Q70DRAFT_1023702 [Cubamyces menziesii]|nr:hypothetical protein C8Q70DRAFT_1023702 [Cubamyces menziesii]